MATETVTGETTATWRGTGVAGVVGGLAGGVVFGAMMTMMMTPVIEMAIPAMYGVDGPALIVGWVFHLFHAAVIGLGFAAIAAAKPGLTATVGKSTGFGALYGIVIWVVLAVIVMPIWLTAVGFPPAPDVPNVNVMSLAGHLVYGIVLGAVFGALNL